MGVLAVIAGCAPAREQTAPVVWEYAAPRPGWPQPLATTRVGAAEVPIALVGTAIALTAPPLTMRSLVGASDGAAEAALSGGDAIELIDVDGGRVRWRDRTAGLPAVAIAGDRVIAAGGDKLVVLDRATGAERGRYAGRWIVGDTVAVEGGVATLGADGLGPAVAIPGVVHDVVADCGDWLLAWRGGNLERWERGAVAWSIASAQPFRVDCERAPMIVSGGAPRAITAIDPTTGAIRGGPIAATDFWNARAGDGVELATARGIERRDRSLGTPVALEAVAIDHLVAQRGARVLVHGADGGPILLDEHGARALAAPGGEPFVVAGEQAFVTGPWRWPLVTQHAQPARFLWPADDAIAAPGLAPPPLLVGDPPRVDLPAPQALRPGVESPGAGAWAIGAIAFDPDDPERLYAIVLEDRPGADRGAGVAAFDLHADRWRWLTADACPPAQPLGLAVTAGVVACGARGLADGAGIVRAVGADDGVVRWEWRGDTVDAMVGGGHAFAIASGAEVTIVDAATGEPRARWRTSDGFLPRVVITAHGADTRVTVLEHGALVTRSLALGLTAIASTAVGGRVTTVAALGDTASAALADGSLVLLDDALRPRLAGALAPRWQARGDLAIATGMNELGDAIVVGIDGDGVPRLEAAIAGADVAALGVRSTAAGAPLAFAASDGRAFVVDETGRARALASLPGPDGASLFATVVDGEATAGVVLARPLRVIRFDLQ